MRPLLLFSVISLVFSYGCTKPEKKPTTALYFFTPYNYAPEYLNGHIKTVKEFNYWAVANSGKYEPGNLVTRKERDSLHWSSDFSAFYSESGVLTRIDYIEPDGAINSWVIDIEKNRLDKATWIAKDTPRIYIKIKYDDEGMVVGSQRFRSKVDTMLYNNYMVHNEKGDIVEVKSFSSIGIFISKDSLFWNSSNRVVASKSFTGTDSLVSSSHTKYNDHGFYYFQEYLNGRGEVVRTIRCDYLEYDPRGNWLSALVYDGGKPIFITKRVYVYY